MSEMFNVSESTLKHIMYFEFGLEFMLGVPTFLFNLYTVIQISRVFTFNSNLKVVLCSASLATAFVALSHPILNAIPREWYSIERGEYKKAIVVYSLLYFTHALTSMSNLKFIIVAIERRLAFKRRRFYEHGSSRLGKTIAFGALLFCLSFASIKTFIFTRISWPGKTLDDRLFASFSFEGSFYHYGFAYSVAGSAFIYAIYEFNRQKRRVRLIRYTGRSLSERFEIKQTRDAINLMRALLKAYGILYFVACLDFGWLAYVYSVSKCGETDVCYHVAANIGYLCLHAYNLFYAFYVVWYFPKLRQMMLKDLCFVGRTDQRATTPSTTNSKVVDVWATQRDHFEILKTVWENTNEINKLNRETSATSK